MAKRVNSRRFSKMLVSLGACDDARKFVKGKTFAEAWAKCTEPNWMEWLIYEVSADIAIVTYFEAGSRAKQKYYATHPEDYDYEEADRLYTNAVVKAFHKVNLGKLRAAIQKKMAELGKDLGKPYAGF
jgi:hypothetical protein